MPNPNLGPVGYHLHFTALIPPWAQERLEERSSRGDKSFPFDAFPLTLDYGTMPYLVVGTLRRAGIKLPEHWADTNLIWPIIHGQAFYIVPTFTDRLWAMSLSIKGVNMRTGRAEEDGLTDTPGQSYWVTCPPWVDGYVPSDGEAVRQFVPLRDGEMEWDASDHVGVANYNPWKDALSAAFYLTNNDTRLWQAVQSYGEWRGGIKSAGSYSTNWADAEGPLTMGLNPADYVMRGGIEEVAPVGIGAGSRMRQRHLDDPSVHAGMYLATPILRITSRLMWVEEFNRMARQAGLVGVDQRTAEGLLRRQAAYESDLGRFLGKPKKSDVDGFPTIG